jgi:hypothetical protein
MESGFYLWNLRAGGRYFVKKDREIRPGVQSKLVFFGN